MKIRYVDFAPDEFLVGIVSLRANEIGIYWIVCCLIYSSGGPIDPDDERIYRLSGADRRTVRSVIDRLVSCKKLTKSLQGLCNERASRELARSMKRASSAQANGKLGGRPSKENNVLDKPDGFAPEKLTINNQQSTINAHARAREGPASGRVVDLDFETFWRLYPRRVARGAALKAYRQARNKTSAETLLSAVKTFASECAGKEPRFIAHAATWLNAERWDDGLEPAAAQETFYGPNGRPWL